MHEKTSSLLTRYRKARLQAVLLYFTEYGRLPGGWRYNNADMGLRAPRLLSLCKKLNLYPTGAVNGQHVDVPRRTGNWLHGWHETFGPDERPMVFNLEVTILRERRQVEDDKTRRAELGRQLPRQRCTKHGLAHPRAHGA